MDSLFISCPMFFVRLIFLQFEFENLILFEIRRESALRRDAVLLAANKCQILCNFVTIPSVFLWLFHWKSHYFSGTAYCERYVWYSGHWLKHIAFNFYSGCSQLESRTVHKSPWLSSVCPGKSKYGRPSSSYVTTHSFDVFEFSHPCLIIPSSTVRVNDVVVKYTVRYMNDVSEHTSNIQVNRLSF